MHSLCKDLYKRDSPVNVFMNQVDPNVVLSLCTAALPPPNMLLFDPKKEKPALLREWLVYRGVQPSAEDSELVEQVMQNMKEKRNSPAMIGFADFDIQNASTQFLKIWLSWFGVGSDSKQSRQWWEEKAQQLQAVSVSTRGQSHEHEHLRMQWKALVDSQQEIDHMVQFVVCSGAELARQEWKAKRLARQAAAGGEDVPVKPLSAKKIQKRWKQHERDLTATSYASQTNTKILIGIMLNAAMAASPLFVNEQGKLTPDKMIGVATNVKEGVVKVAFAEQKKEVAVEQITAAWEAVSKGADVNLVVSGLSIFLNELGFSSVISNVLPIFLRQLNDKQFRPPELLNAINQNDQKLANIFLSTLVRALSGGKPGMPVKAF